MVEYARETYSKTGSHLLGSIAIVHPFVISTLLMRAETAVGSVGEVREGGGEGGRRGGREGEGGGQGGKEGGGREGRGRRGREGGRRGWREEGREEGRECGRGEGERERGGGGREGGREGRGYILPYTLKVIVIRQLVLASS